jgi:hypothetical protein
MPIYERIKEWVQQSEKEKKLAKEQGKDPTESAPFGKGSLGKEFQMKNHLSDIRENIKRGMCGMCADLSHEPHVIDCGHIFCKDCIIGHMHGTVVEDSDVSTSDFDIV